VLINEGQSALQIGDLTTAENYFIEAHEKASDAITRDIASAALLDSILFPQKRFSEAVMWIRSIVSNELYEAQKKSLKAFAGVPVLVRAPKNELWKLVDLDSQWPNTKDQQIHFDRLLKKMLQTVHTKEQRDVYSSWPGPGFTGLVKGIWNEAAETFLSMGIQRETVAMAAYDYINYIMEDHLGSEETNPFTFDAPYRDEAEDKIIELVSQGDTWAMKELGIRFDRKSNMEVVALKSGDKQQALDWYNKALMAGSKTVYQPISECYPKDSPEQKNWLLRGANAGDPVALNNLGIKFQADNDFHTAAYYYRRAAEFDRSNSANLSQMLYLIGLIEESRVWLERAIENKDNKSVEVVAKVQELINGYEARQRVSDKHPIGGRENFIELFEDVKKEFALTLCNEINSMMNEIDELNNDSNPIVDLAENSDNAEDIFAGAMIARGFIEGTISISEETLPYLEATHEALSDILESGNPDEDEEE
jgi:tetratricopeptide (TPR) repeat protein